MFGLLALCHGCTLFAPAPPEAALRQHILLPQLDAEVVRSPDFPPSPVPPEAAPAAADGPLTLEQAIDAAERLNPHLQVLQQRVEQARAGRQVAFADFLPSMRAIQRHVVGVPSATRFVLPTIPTAVGNVAFGGASDRFDTTELMLQWTLWDFGRTAGRYGQAASTATIAELTYQRARQTVAFNVAAAYFRLLEAGATRAIAEEAVKRAESALRDARNFLKRGTAVRNDVLRAEVQLAEMRLDLVRARTAEAVAVANLNQEIGFNVNCPTRVVDRPREPAFDLPLAECLQLAVSNREEFRVVLQSITSAQYGVDVVRAEFLPVVQVAGSSVHLSGNEIPNSRLTSGGLSVELGLFEGGKRTGRLRGARAEVAATVAQGKEVCDRIAYEVDVAFLTIDDARQRIELSRTAVGQARENLRVVTNLFRQGDATPTDMVDAELTMIRAQQNYYTALYDYQTGLARLLYAVGLPPGGAVPTSPLAAAGRKDDTILSPLSPEAGERGEDSEQGVSP